MSDLSHARDGLDALGIMLYGHSPVPKEWVGGPDAKILHDAADRLATLEANWNALIDTSIAASEKLQKRIAELEETCLHHAQIETSLSDRIKELEDRLDDVQDEVDNLDEAFNHPASNETYRNIRRIVDRLQEALEQNDE